MKMQRSIALKNKMVNTGQTKQNLTWSTLLLKDEPNFWGAIGGNPSLFLAMCAHFKAL